MPHFDTLNIYLWKTLREKEKAIFPFLTMFSILYGTYFSFQMHFEMSSAFSFNLDQSKVLSFGKGLTHSHTMTPFDAPWKQAFRKHCGKRRNCS